MKGIYSGKSVYRRLSCFCGIGTHYADFICRYAGRRGVVAAVAVLGMGAVVPCGAMTGNLSVAADGCDAATMESELLPGTVVPEIVLPGTEGSLARARRMFDDGNYIGAADELRHALASLPNGRQRIDARVLLARTLLLTGNDECLSICDELRSEEGTSPAGVAALLIEGDWYFFRREYGEASLWYEQVADLRVMPEYAYRQGICRLYTGRFAQGLELLEPLAAGDSEYRIPALFYIAWSHYADNKLATARRELEQVSALLGKANAVSDGCYGEYLPTELDAGYYLAQIDFREGDFQGAYNRASGLLGKNMPANFRRELNRIAGESLFRLNRYDEAEGYLKAYLKESGNSPCATAAYAMGSIAYDDGRYDEAVALLEPIADMDDVTGQGAALLLGQIAAGRSDYSAAALYFDKAQRNARDNQLTEQALYNYITAIANGAETPFTSSTELGEKFLQYFPGSEYESNVREFLSAAYYRDKDYARALESLDKISHPTATQLKARQLVLYELGMSELSNGLAESAERHLREAAGGSDARVGAQAELWLGQALYAQGKFGESEQAYRNYMRRDPNGENMAQARYDAAYALYMQDKFSEAAREFTSALSMKTLPARLRTDATMRLADCKYYLRDYAEAARLYGEVEHSTDGDKAYAAMRAAIMEGLRGNLEAEISGLRRMTTTYATSRWTPTAMYELGTALSRNGDIEEAAATYASVSERWPDQEAGRRAQLQLGTLYSSHGKPEEAIAAYKEVIRRWPTGDEAKAANVELRRLMSERGEVAAYAEFMNSIPGAPKVDNAEMERLSYEAADNRLVASAKDTAPMEEYLHRYPDGLYVAAGLLRLAESLAQEGKYEESLSAVATLERQRPDSRQLPEALMLRAEILEGQYSGRTAEALSSWRRAEQLLGADVPADVYAGIMRLTDNSAERLEYSRRLKAMGSLTSEEAQEADFYEAEALASMGKVNEAVVLYSTLAKQPSSLYGARAAVAEGELLIKEKRYKEAEKVLSEFTSAGTVHSYWLARGYIALADAVAAQGRKALAREYLNALKSNYPGDEPDIMKKINEGLRKY